MLGEGEVQGQQSLIRLHLHRSEEPYYHSEELFPISSHLRGEHPPRGAKRTYFHAKPYMLIPRITLTIGLTRPKVDSNEIGRVIGSDVTKLQELEMGNAQAWYYPTERGLSSGNAFCFSHLQRKTSSRMSCLLQSGRDLRRRS
jgi:hypothetical protein